MSIEAELSEASAYTANNYAPLPVVLTSGDGAWVTDVEGRRYLDALAGYSALNFGHRHPALIAAAEGQLSRLTLTSRAFHHDQFGPFCRALAVLTSKQAVLPMNTGAEAVETAVKLARRWGYTVRGVPPDQATIIVAAGNFHGRTTTIVGFSTDPLARDGFGPFPAGFRIVPYDDVDSLAAAIDDTTVAVLVEPVQGEAGVVIPRGGYLQAIRRITRERGILFLADEVQSGLGRTGTTFACDREEVIPDVYILGKALGGGIVPLSAIAADRELMDVFTPGSHGSTFGGNPLACAVGRAVVDLLETGEYQRRSRSLGERLATGLRDIGSAAIAEVRTVGFWAGVEFVKAVPARAVCERLLERGVLAKDAHEHIIRLAPPLVADEEDVDLLVEAVSGAVRDVAGRVG